jgi:hypothetical protein
MSMAAKKKRKGGKKRSAAKKSTAKKSASYKKWHTPGDPKNGIPTKVLVSRFKKLGRAIQARKNSQAAMA